MKFRIYREADSIIERIITGRTKLRCIGGSPHCWSCGRFMHRKSSRQLFYDGELIRYTCDHCDVESTHEVRLSQ